MNSNASYTAKTLKNLPYSFLFETFQQVKGNFLRNDGIKTFSVELYALIKLRKEELSPFIVLFYFVVDIVFKSLFFGKGIKLAREIL